MALMYSIKPKYVQSIISPILQEKKTVELRTKLPKELQLGCECKAYIYCTKGEKLMWVYLNAKKDEEVTYLDGKVIGEFNAYRYAIITEDTPEWFKKLIAKQACVSLEEMKAYAKGSPLYAIYLDELTIYDIPRELSDYTLCICPEMPYCPDCKLGGVSVDPAEVETYHLTGSCSTHWNCYNTITRPPQSYYTNVGYKGDE